MNVWPDHRRSGMGGAGGSGGAGQDPRYRLARRLLAELDARDRFLPADLLGDPVWRLLLDLYVRRAEGKSTCVSSACIAARAPQTTALRLLQTMERRGLILRVADGADNRRVVVSLTTEAACAVETYLALLGNREGSGPVPGPACA